MEPGNSDTIYLGAASGGVWKTTDGGLSWVPIFDNIGTLTIGSIYVEPGNTDHVWVGTGEHMRNCISYFGLGLYKSEDGGATFVEKNGSGAFSLNLSYINGLAVHRSQPQIVLAGGHGYCDDGATMGGGLYRSTDGGTTWNLSLNDNVTEIVMRPTDHNTFFAAIGDSGNNNGVWTSTDSGATWQKISLGLPSSFSRMRLSISPSNPLVLYALTYPGGNGSALFRTSDGGANWTLQNSNACEDQCFYNQCLAVHPTNPDRIVVGSIRFAESNNAGASLNYLVSGWGSSQKVHQDTHVLVFDPANGDRFWVGGDGGLWRTDDGGTNYTNLNSGLNITQFYDIAVDPGDQKKILGGAQDNSSSMTEGNKEWDVTVVTGDGFMNLIDPLDTQTVYQTSYPQSVPSVVRSRNGGNGGWSWLSGNGLSSGEPWPWVTPMAISVDPAGTASHLFIGSNRIYRSDNDADLWTALSTSSLISSGSFRVIVPHVQASSLEVYAGSSTGRIFMTANALNTPATWTEITHNYGASYVSDIAVTPGDNKWIFAVSGRFGVNNQVYRSSDGGSSWVPVGTGIPNIPANTVAIDPLDPQRIFVGTDIGVYVSTDRGDTFVPMMNGMPLGNVVTDLEIDDNPYVLTAGTYGRGAWQAPLLQVLTLEPGMNQATCTDHSVSVSAAASNGSGDLTWTWSVNSGPDPSDAQFDDIGLQVPWFTPTTMGLYVLRVEAEDSGGQKAEAFLEVNVGNVEVFSQEMIDLWSQKVGTAHDRNGNGQIDVLDLLTQQIDPICL